MTSYSNSASQTSNYVLAQILSVNTDIMVAEVGTRGNSKLTVALGYQSGNTLIIPDVGEQWIIERVQNEWRLVSRLPYQDEKMNAPLYPGSTYVGSKGPTFVHGEGLVVPAGAVVLGDVAGESAVTVMTDDHGNLLAYGRGHSGRVGPKSATVPASVSLVHTASGQRAIGFGTGLQDGVPVGAMTATKVIYVFGSIDGAGGSTTVQLFCNGVVVPGSTLTVAANSQVSAATIAARTATLTGVTFSEADLVTINVTAVPGVQAGNRLSAILVGARTATLTW